MTEKTEQDAKPDGSAWEAHMEAVASRNADARNAGRKRRQEHEREQAASHRASELRQMVALSRATDSGAKSQRP